MNLFKSNLLFSYDGEASFMMTKMNI